MIDLSIHRVTGIELRRTQRRHSSQPTHDHDCYEVYISAVPRGSDEPRVAMTLIMYTAPDANLIPEVLSE